LKIHTHYDAIPAKYYLGTVLDIGSRDGENQRKSKHWPLIDIARKNNRYTTIDIDESDFVDIKGDIFNILPDMITRGAVFENVLAIHILEHLHYEQWGEIIDYMKELVAPMGTLVIGTPYMEVPPVKYRVIGPDHLKHHTTWIDCRYFVRFLGNSCQFKVYQADHSMAILCFWRKKDEMKEVIK
jgi:2-polyprenyl-3-methyl-5-hydroxy-6-metoxy-1,4-benzoquinol methylase